MDNYSVTESLTEKEYWPEFRSEIIRNWQDDKLKIREFIIRRNVKRLCHFTQGENLNSIYDYGLISRKSLIEKDIAFIKTDQSIKLLFEDFIYVSITEPNKTMLEAKYKQGAWPVVVILDPKILWKQPFFSIPFNSARTEIHGYLNEFRNYTTGINALKTLYLGETIRNKFQIDLPVPTDPASEILFLDRIDPKYFKTVLISEILRNSDRFLRFAKIFGFFENGSFKKYEWKEIKSSEIDKWSWINNREENNARRWNSNWFEDGI